MSTEQDQKAAGRTKLSVEAMKKAQESQPVQPVDVIANMLNGYGLIDDEFIKDLKHFMMAQAVFTMATGKAHSVILTPVLDASGSLTMFELSTKADDSIGNVTIPNSEIWMKCLDTIIGSHYKKMLDKANDSALPRILKQRIIKSINDAEAESRIAPKQ